MGPVGGSSVSPIFRARFTTLTMASPPSKCSKDKKKGTCDVRMHGVLTAATHAMSGSVTMSAPGVSVSNVSLMNVAPNTSPRSTSAAPVVLPPGVPETMPFLKRSMVADSKVEVISGPSSTPSTVPIPLSALPLRMGFTTGPSSA